MTDFVYLLELNPRDPSTNVATRMGFSTGGADAPVYDGLLWKPGLITALNFRGTVNGLPSGGTCAIAIGAGDREALKAYRWDNSIARVYRAAASVPGMSAIGAFTLIRKARVRDVTWNRDVFTVQLSDAAWVTGLAVQTTAFLGTGTYEGPATLKGKLKPLAFGTCHQAAPVLIDPTNMVYQVHERRVSSIAVYDNLVPLTIFSVADVYTASPRVPGAAYVDLARGVFRLGAPAAGKVTCDVVGEADTAAGGFVGNALQIVQRLLSWKGGLAAGDIDSTTLNALNTSRPWACGIYIPEGAGNVWDYCVELAASVDCWLSVNALDQVTGGLRGFGTSLGSIDDFRRQGTQRVQSDPPSWRQRVGYDRAFEVTPVADGFDATTQGRNLQPNGDFSAGDGYGSYRVAGWTSLHVSPLFAGPWYSLTDRSVDPPWGKADSPTRAMILAQCTSTGQSVEYVSEDFIPVDTAKAWTLEGWFMGASGTPRGYLGIYCYDAAKAQIGAGPIYIAANNVTFALAVWQQYWGTIGPGQANAFPAGTAFVKIRALPIWQVVGSSYMGRVGFHEGTRPLTWDSVQAGATSPDASEIARAAADEGIVPNGNFGLGLRGWDVASGTPPSGAWRWVDDTANGSASALLVGYAAGVNYAVGSKTFRLYEGRKYKVRLRARRVTLGGPAQKGFRLTFLMKSAFALKINSGNYDQFNQFILDSASVVTGAYAWYDFEYTVPTGMSWGTILAENWSPAQAITEGFYVDQIEVTPFAAAAQWGADVTANNQSQGTLILDTRAVNGSPASYPVGKTTEFKQRATVGAPGVATYGTLVTDKPYVDNTGGHATQMFLSSDGIFARRAGNSDVAWGAWTTVFNSLNKPSITNLDLAGQFSAALANNYFAAAAIGYALIGSVDAATITVGQLVAAQIAANQISTGHLTANSVTLGPSASFGPGGSFLLTSTWHTFCSVVCNIDDVNAFMQPFIAATYDMAVGSGETIDIQWRMNDVSAGVLVGAPASLTPRMTAASATNASAIRQGAFNLVRPPFAGLGRTFEVQMSDQGTGSNVTVTGLDYVQMIHRR
jgi:hypothetical protein